MTTLLCEECGADVGAAYEADQDTGWLVWWDAGKDEEVEHIDIVCHGATVSHLDRDKTCLAMLDRRRKERLTSHDNHLSEFAGALALPEMWRLMRDYEWSEKASHRLLSIFTELQALPTAKPVHVRFAEKEAAKKNRVP